MIRIISLPMLIFGLMSLIFFFFYHYLGIKLKKNDTQHRVFLLFSILSFTNFVYSTSFFMMMNSGTDIQLLSFFNRLTIAVSMFMVSSLISFSKFNYNLKYNFDVYIILVCNVIFSILTFVNTPLFLYNEFVDTSRFYKGLEAGVLFPIWGIYVLLIMTYAFVILTRAFFKNRKGEKNYPNICIILSALIWLVTGVADALTAIQILDTPPLTWLGSILMIISIAIMLVSKIEFLYKKIDSLYDEIIHDSLTGVFSRSFFDVEFNKAVIKLERTEHQNYLVMLDVDNFKNINDSYGHICGDEVLKSVADVLTQSLRSNDIVARYGGDEFVLLLSENISIKDVNLIIERTRDSISKVKIKCKADEIKITCSFGITVFNQNVIEKSISKEVIIATADKALYLSKDRGKNRVNFCDI